MIAVMIAGAVAMFVSLVCTRYLITFFRTRGTGQPILGKEDNGPEHHMMKQGTPTMGGLAIVVSAAVGWMVAHLRPNLAFSDQAMIMWVGIVVMAGMGFLDDFIKVRKRHNRGIFWKQKSYITLGLSMLLAWWLVSSTDVSQTLSITRATFPGWHLAMPVFVVFTGVMIWATSNAVNVTDGLDGLAGGSAMMGFLAFTIIAYWEFRNPAVYGDVINPDNLKGRAAGWFQAGNLGGMRLGGGLCLWLMQSQQWSTGAAAALLAVLGLACSAGLLLVREPPPTGRLPGVVANARALGAGLWALVRSRVGALAVLISALALSRMLL